MMMRYIEGVVTLEYKADKCVACGMCQVVCPHRIFVVKGQKAQITDKDSCMECGACMMNCPTEAIKVTQGTGCAMAIMTDMIRKIKSRFK